MKRIEHLRNYVTEIREFLAPDECKEIIRHAESNGFEKAFVNSGASGQLIPEIRNNDRLIEDDITRANFLWDRLQPHLGASFRNRKVLGLNERFRYYRYGAGQKFDWHKDGYFERDNQEISQLTFMIYLNEDCEGGGTTFCDVQFESDFPTFTVQPRTGSALLFYHPIMHRGDRVLSGTKYVLRSDVMYEYL